MAGCKLARSKAVSENLEDWDGIIQVVEVGRKLEGVTVVGPNGPMVLSCAGALRNNGGSLRCLCKAQVKEESIAGRRWQMRYGWDCG